MKAATSYQGLDYAISADDITGLIPPGTPVGMNQGEWPEHTWHHLSMRRFRSPACDRLQDRRYRGAPYNHGRGIEGLSASMSVSSQGENVNENAERMK